MEKITNRSCPVCGEIYTKKNIDKITLHSISVRMNCDRGHSWIENYTLSYQGYEHGNKKYNQFGGELK